MNWLNLEIRTLRSPEYLGSSPAERATWLNVLAFCCEQENGGRITAARAWKDRQWQQVCGVTMREVDRASKLLSWDGDDLVISFYPLDKQEEVAAKRQRARVNGARGGRPAKGIQEPTSELISVSENNQCPKAEGKGIGKEVERNRNVPADLPLPLNPQTSPSAPLGEANDVRPKSEEAKAVAALFGRRIETPWSEKEIKAFKGVVRRGVITVEAISKISAYYAAERKKGGSGNHRRDLKTFLNNFDGELDRANAFAANPKSNERTNSNNGGAPSRNAGHNAAVSYANRPGKTA